MGVLKSLFGKDLELEKLPEEIRPLVQEMRLERVAYENAVQKAEQAGTTIKPTLEKLAEIEKRLAALDVAAKQITDLKQGAGTLGDEHKNLESRLAETRSLAESARTALEGMRTQLADLVAARKDLPVVAEQAKALTGMRAETDAVDKRVRELSATVTQLTSAEQKLEAAGARAEKFLTRAEGLERAVEQLQQLIKEVPDTKRELSSLNVLAEFVSRKVATLETQRDLVDKATQRGERLTELTTQVDRKLQEQHDNMKFLERLEKNVEEIRKQHQAALDAATEVDRKYRALDGESQRLTDDFSAQKASLQQSADRFKFEREGLDALNARIAELRDLVTSVEKRAPGLEQTRTDLDKTTADLKRLNATVKDMSKQASELQSTQTMALSAQTRVRELLVSVGELTSRMEAISPAKLERELDDRAKQLDEVRTRVAGLEHKSADWRALEEETGRALEVAKERFNAVNTLKADLQRIFSVADGAVAQVRTVVELQQQIDARRAQLEPVLAKLKDLDSVAATLESRERQFAEAEQRLARLDALLIDLQSTLETVMGHKEFLERVVETSGNLALQTMQAEAAINTLRETTGETRSRRK